MNIFSFNFKIYGSAFLLSLAAISSVKAQSIRLFTRDHLGYCSREALRQRTRLYTRYINEHDEARGQYGYQRKTRAVENYYLPRLENNINSLVRRKCLVNIAEGTEAIVVERYEADAVAPYSDFHNLNLFGNNTYNVLKIKLPKYNEYWYIVHDPDVLRNK